MPNSGFIHRELCAFAVIPCQVKSFGQSVVFSSLRRLLYYVASFSLWTSTHTPSITCAHTATHPVWTKSLFHHQFTLVFIITNRGMAMAIPMANTNRLTSLPKIIRTKGHPRPSSRLSTRRVSLCPHDLLRWTGLQLPSSRARCNGGQRERFLGHSPSSERPAWSWPQLCTVSFNFGTSYWSAIFRNVSAFFFNI